VTDLDAFQMRVTYDAAVVLPTTVDSSQLLGANAGSSVVETADPLPDADGTLVLAASDISGGGGESGDGVLSRISFEAIGAGSSQLTLAIDATAPATPAMFDTTATAIGDTNGDTIFDGPIFNAAVGVGEGCGDFIPNELLVSFFDGTPQPTIDAAIAAYGTEQIEYLADLDVYWLRISSGSSVPEVVSLFESDPNVEFAEPNVLQEPRDHHVDPTDMGFKDSELWFLTNVGANMAPDNASPGAAVQRGLIDADVDAPQAWDIRVNDCRGETPATPVRIAIIDDGIDAGHPDFAGNIDLVNSRNTVTNVTGGAAVQHNAGESHGTEVASVIGAAANGTDLVGICWQAQMVVYKFVTSTGAASTAGFARAIDNIISLNAGGANIRVVNYSWGGVTADATSQRALARLAASLPSVVFVTAAGNDGVDVDKAPSFPCSYTFSNIICVGATDNQDVLAADPDFDPNCSNQLDDDGDTLVNDGCPTVGGGQPETGAQCGNAVNDDVADDAAGPAGPRVNDGCPAVGAFIEINAGCTNAVDDDGDTVVNDGCPVVGGGEPETGAQCLNRIDDDFADDVAAGGPSVVNDGCGAAASETGAQCTNAVDDDADTVVNDGCPSSAPEAGTACTNAIDDDGDTSVNDGCPPVINYSGIEASVECSNATDDDVDGTVNDGCPTVGGGEPEAGGNCANAVDDDPLDDGAGAGAAVNDGCPAVGPAEAGGNCANAVDDDADTTVNDGCPTVGGATPETGAQCMNATDDDAADDVAGPGARVNDGCPAVTSNSLGETVAQCANAIDDDGDTVVNDGCAVVGSEAGGQCANAIDDDADTLVNDGCPPAGAGGGEVQLAEDGGAPGSCRDGLDKGGDGSADFYDADCWVTRTWSNFGATSVDILAPGDDLRVLCNRSPTKIDIDGDGLTSTCDPSDFSSDADGDLIADGPNDPDGAGGAESASICANGADGDGDGFYNDGCPASGPAEAGAQCARRDRIDDDGDTSVNDGCPANGGAESVAAPVCTTAFDSDFDGYPNDGCGATGAGAPNNAENNAGNPCPAGSTAQCGTANACSRGNRVDDDNDGTINDGCPVVNIAAGTDVCMTIPDPAQTNSDGDDRGDSCDPSRRK
jgi:hypothetical protein